MGAKTLVSFTMAVGSVAAAYLATAIAAAVAVEIVGVGAASAAADYEANGTTAVAAKVANFKT